MKTQRLVALLPIALFAACGGSSDFASDHEDPSLALDELPGEFAAAQCDLLQRCASVYYDILFSLEDCKTLVERQVRQGGWGEIEQAVDDGRIAYDGKSAASCITAVNAIECADSNQRPVGECENALQGSVAAGDDCDIDEECESGLICDTNLMCPGQCSPRRVAGLECQRNDDCASGLVCSALTQRCVQPRGLGEPCGGGVDPECDGGLACLGDDPMAMETGICTPFDELELVGANETCNLDTGILCEAGLSCVLVELAGAVFECRPIPSSGGACGIGFPEHCPRGQYCPLTGEQVLTGTLESTCAPLPAEGQPCAVRPIDVLPRCEAYARCEATTAGESCVGLRELGESCSDDRFCYSGNCVAGGCAVQRACE